MLERNNLGRRHRPGARHRIAVVLTCLALPSLAAAQSTPSVSTSPAETVARQVQQFYSRVADVRAEFEQAYFHKLYDRSDCSNGSVVFKKPGKMRWDYRDRFECKGAAARERDGKVIISDGKRLRIYEPGSDGEPGQLFEQAVQQSELPEVLSFLTGSMNIVDGFNLKLANIDHSKHQGFEVLELRPKTPNPNYDVAIFYVDTAGKQPGAVRRVVIRDRAGNRNRLDFKALQFNTAPKENTFAWTPPKGTRTIKP